MPECSLLPKSYSLFPYFRSTIESKVQSLLTFKFLIFYHSSLNAFECSYVTIIIFSSYIIVNVITYVGKL